MSKPPPCAPGRSCLEIAPAIRPRMRNAMKGGVGGEHVPDDGQDLVGDGDEGFLVSLLEADDDIPIWLGLSFCQRRASLVQGPLSARHPPRASSRRRPSDRVSSP